MIWIKAWIRKMTPLNKVWIKQRGWFLGGTCLGIMTHPVTDSRLKLQHKMLHEKTFVYLWLRNSKSERFHTWSIWGIIWIHMKGCKCLLAKASHTHRQYPRFVCWIPLLLRWEKNHVTYFGKNIRPLLVGAYLTPTLLLICSSLSTGQIKSQ